MAKQQAEDEQNLKRKARRRLIGAVALTLAVVVILPMVLDSEPKPGGRDIDLSIPAPDKAGEFVMHVPVSEVAVPLPTSAVVVASSAPVALAQLPDAAKPTTVVASQPKQALPGKAKPGSQKSAEVQKSPQVQKSSEPPPSETSSTDKPPGTESFVAQVGAYSNSNTAQQELKKLKKWGFKAYTEKAGDKTRVRVGPYPDRDKAEKVIHQLEKHGLHPVIISAK